MPNLNLKNIPEELYARLKERAARHHRSLNSEILVSLEKVFRSVRVEPEEFLARLDGLHRQLEVSPLTDDILHRAKNERRP